MKPLNTHEMTQTFTNNGFELDSFKELLTQIFPNIVFVQTPQTRALNDSKLLTSYTEICKPLDVGGGLKAWSRRF